MATEDEKPQKQGAEFVTQLNQRDPFVQWHLTDVQFPITANTDYVIRHNLKVSAPRDVHYRVVKQFTGGTIYESADPTTKAWGSDFIVLRSDTEGWTGRLLLGTLNRPSRFATELYTIPTTTPVAATTDLGIALTVDGGGGNISTGFKNSILVPFDCTIASVTLLSCDAAITTGSIVIDIYKDVYANYPPTGADSICGATKPTISSDNSSFDNSLTGWDTTINSGDVLGFNVDSVTDLKRVTLILGVVE